MLTSVLTGKALAFDDKHIVNAARTALQKWRNRNTQRQLLLQQTALFSERVLQERMLRVWRERISERKTSLVQAAGTRKFFLIKRGWDKWRARHQQKQQELFLEERKKEECRTVFKCESSRCYSRSARILTYIVSHTAWITKTKRAKSLRLREQEFANIHNKVDTFESM